MGGLGSASNGSGMRENLSMGCAAASAWHKLCFGWSKRAKSLGQVCWCWGWSTSKRKGIAPIPWAVLGNQQGSACLLGKPISILFICVEFNSFNEAFSKIRVSSGTSQSRVLQEMLIYLGLLQSFICLVLLFNSGCAPYLKGLSSTFWICWTTWQLVKYVTA